MGIIARIYDFVAGTKIRSADVDAELNQLVSAHNVHDAEIDSLEAGRQLLSEKGMANGYAPLNSSAKIDSIYILDSILGQLEYQGTYNATTDSPTLPSASGVKGHYYIISTGGTVSGVVYNVGDWIVSNGTAWEKVDNTDAVAAVFGRTGTILPATNDYTFAQINKATSSLADLTTRSAADLSSGILPDARMPDLTGDVTTNEGTVATTIAAGAVGTTKLANEAVTNPKLGPLSITNDKVANATLTAAKFASGELTNESANGVAITALQADTTQRGINVKSAPYNAIGDGVADDTAALLAAATAASVATGTLIIPAGTYLTDTLAVPSNFRIVLEPGAVIKAKTGFGLEAVLLDFNGASNVYMECNNAIFQMIKSEYTTGEHRHVFNLKNCTNITIVEAIAKDSGGDGFYINNAVNTRIVRSVADNNRRQGCSIIGANGLWLIECDLKNTIGTSPQAGLDIEPNTVSDVLKNIWIINTNFENNAGAGINIFLQGYVSSSAVEDIDIHIINPRTKSNLAEGLRIKNVYAAAPYGGLIEVSNLKSYKDGKNGIFISDKSEDAAYLKVSDALIISPANSGTVTYPEYIGVHIADTALTVSGSMDIDVTVKSKNAYMQYGVDIVGLFTSLKLKVQSVIGATVNPIWSNAATNTSRLFRFNVDSALIETPYTGIELSIYAKSYGEIFTNSGATATVSFRPRDYLPIGTGYKFRVKADYILRVDPYNAGDIILGSSAAGKYIQCSQTGGEMELIYIGGLIFVPRIISGTWTFEP